MGEWASLRRGRENAEQVSFFTVVPEVSSAPEGVSGMPALRARGTPAEVLGVQGFGWLAPWLARTLHPGESAQTRNPQPTTKVARLCGSPTPTFLRVEKTVVSHRGSGGSRKEWAVAIAKTTPPPPAAAPAPKSLR